MAPSFNLWKISLLLLLGLLVFLFIIVSTGFEIYFAVVHHGAGQTPYLRLITGIIFS